MSKFAIIADTTCDLGEEFVEKYNVDVLPGHIELPNGTEILSYPRWDHWTKEEFYTSLKKDPDAFATSPTNVQEFAQAFEKYVKDGTDVLAMTISSGLSGTYNFAVEAKKEVMEKYPNANIQVIDSMRFGPGFGLLVIHAAELRQEGKSIDEVVAYVEENKNRYHQAGWLDDLSFVAKKGRLTHAKAFFGTLAGVKPIGEFDYNGLTTVLGKAKGAKSAYALLLDYIEKTIENPEEQIILIAQTNRMPQAEEYKKMIKEKFNPKEIYIIDVHPSSGVNVGPGLMAAYYVGTPISKDLENEKKIVNDFIEKAGK